MSPASIKSSSIGVRAALPCLCVLYEWIVVPPPNIIAVPPMRINAPNKFNTQIAMGLSPLYCYQWLENDLTCTCRYPLRFVRETQFQLSCVSVYTYKVINLTLLVTWAVTLPIFASAILIYDYMVDIKKRYGKRYMTVQVLLLLSGLTFLHSLRSISVHYKYICAGSRPHPSLEGFRYYVRMW